MDRARRLSEESSRADDQPGTVRCSASSAGFAGAGVWMLASDGGAPAPRRPAGRISGMLASDGGAPAPRRPAARTASWGEVRKGGEAHLRGAGSLTARGGGASLAAPVAGVPRGASDRGTARRGRKGEPP